MSLLYVTAVRIMHKLGFHKVCMQCVLPSVLENLKVQRMAPAILLELELCSLEYITCELTLGLPFNI